MDKERVKILICDDSPTQLQLLKHSLEKDGYTVIDVKNGKDALDLLIKNKPAMVISDILMPGMNGYELCHAIKTNNSTKEIPVVLLTTLSNKEDIVKGLESKVDYYITKPYEEHFLLSQVAMILKNPPQSIEVNNIDNFGFNLDDRECLLNIDPQQVVNLLFTTYENTININKQMMETQIKLRESNEELDKKIHELNEYHRELDFKNIELQKVQYELIESKKIYTDLFDFAPVGYCLLDKHGTVNSVNSTALHLLDRDKQETINKNLSDFVLEQDRNIFFNHLNLVSKSRLKQECEIQFRRKSGEIIYTRFETAMVDSDQLDEIHYRSVFEDITEKKKFEKQLMDSERNFRLIAETIPDIIIRTDNDVKIEYASPKIEDYLGFYPKDVKEKPLRSFVAQEDETKFIEYVGKLKNLQYPGLIELSMLNNLGETIITEVNSAPVLFNNNTAGIIFTVHDIRERKKNEMKILRESNIETSITKLSKAIITKTPLNEIAQMIYEIMAQFLDSDNGYVAYYDNELHSMKFSILSGNIWKDCKIYRDRILPEKCTGCCNWVTNNKTTLLINNFDREAVDFSVKRCNIDIKRVLCVPAMIKEQLTGMLLVCNANREYSADDKKLLERLANIYAIAILQKETEKKLIDAKRSAEEATTAKSNFLANMSHEIRTPMNAIIGMGHLMNKTNLTTKQQDYIHKMSHAANNLLGIINDILDFSKIEAGKMDMETVDFDLFEVTENLSNVAGIKTQEKGLEFIVKMDSNVPSMLIGDPLRLGQILLNLVNNAIKFTSDGEVVVLMELEFIEGRDVMLKFSVKDTGIGMNKEQQSKLFQVFSQADTSTTRKFGGTGLGLSICKRLVHMMDGEIGVESEESTGSTFWFTAKFLLPENAQKKRYILPKKLQNLKVFIVDDNETARIVLSEYCSDLHFIVETFSSGEQVIHRLMDIAQTAESNPDIILMDWKMPGWSGLVTSQKILNEKAITPKPKIIMISSYSGDELERESKSIGLDSYLMKPVSRSMLHDAILSIFNKEIGVENNKHSKIIAPKELEKIKGARVLLIEDNEINQQIARELLEEEGFLIDIADDGNMGLDMIKSETYDLVFMDLQMPIMDGFKTTSEIRKFLDKDQLPIIAMTADAMEGTKEEVLRTGMNHYITKPIDPDAIFNVMIEFIKPAKGDEYMLKLNGINTEQGLYRVNGNEKLYKKVLLLFLDKNRNIMDDIIKAINNNELETAHHLVHSLKGVSGNIGAMTLYELSKSVEEHLKFSGIDIPQDKLKTLETELIKVIKSIEALNDNKEDEEFLKDSSKKLSKNDLISLVDEIYLLVNKDLAVAMLKVEELKTATHGTDWDDKIRKISNNLDIFNIDEATDQLEQLKEDLTEEK